MKNLVFVIADLGPGGAQRVMCVLTNFLANNPDYHIDVVATSAPDDRSFFNFHEKVCIHYASIQSSSGSLLSGILVNVKRVFVLRKILKKLKPDLIISFLTEINCLSLLSALFTGIPVIVSERSDPFVHPEVRLWRGMRRATYPLATYLVCQTEHAASFFPYMKRKSVVYNPVNTMAVSSGDDAPVVGPYILGVGRQSAEKGFDLLIMAHAVARNAAPDLKLVLLGRGPDRSQLQALAKALGTVDHVIFAGAQADLGSYYKNALAFILPSRFEGMPNALLEAMACGTPVIVTPQFRAGPEIVEDGKSGIIPAQATPAAFGDAILALYGDPALCRKLGGCAQESMGRFDPVNIGLAWEQVIRRAL